MKVRQAALFGAVSLVFATSAFAQLRDHVVCYASKSAKKACTNLVPAGDLGKLCEDDLGCNGVDTCASLPKFPKGVLARLNDDGPNVGEDKTFTLKKPNHLCVPVDKNDEGILDAATSWVTYPIKQAGTVCNGGDNDDLPCKETADCPGGGTCDEIPKFDGKAAQNINILVEDQYTNIRVNASKVDFLMVPASRCNGNNDAACVVGGNAAPAADTREHYKCYKAKATKTVCAAGQTNAFEACAEDANCMPGGEDTCVALPKFTKGQDAYLLDFNGDFMTAERTFGVSKLSHFCKAVEKTVPPGDGIPEGPVNDNTRMLCYKSKASKGQCALISPTNDYGACKKDEDCGGISETLPVECVEQLKFNKEDVDVLGLYVNDQFDVITGGPTTAGDYHRTNLSKEDLFCMPACEGDIPFSSHVLRATSLQIPPTGFPGDGQNVDNLATCQPFSNDPNNPLCSNGIDNVLGFISGTIDDLNEALEDAVDSGDINIVLEINDFANGAQTVNGYTGELDSPAGCTDNDPNSPPTAVNDPNQVCNWQVGGASFNLNTCDAASDISFPVTVTGLPSSPATIEGGGIGSDLAFSLPFGEIPIQITARNVKVSASVVHSGGVVVSGTGALGGAISSQELKTAIESLPEGICEAGVNDGDPCTVATETTDCPSSFCQTAYLGGFDKPTIISLLDVLIIRDIDLDGIKTCQSGDGNMNNNGEPCAMDNECPVEFVNAPPACDQNDAHSIGIKFSGINATISDAERECTAATCSLF